MTENLYSVSGYLTVDAASPTAAETAAASAITAIKTALTTLANGTELSVVEENGSPAFDIPDGEQGAYNAECQLLVPSDSQGDAQGLAEAAQAAITTALASGHAGVSVSLQEETQGAEGGFVFNLLQ